MSIVSLVLAADDDDVKFAESSFSSSGRIANGVYQCASLNGEYGFDELMFEGKKKHIARMMGISETYGKIGGLKQDVLSRYFRPNSRPLNMKELTRSMNNVDLHVWDSPTAVAENRVKKDFGFEAREEFLMQSQITLNVDSPTNPQANFSHGVKAASVADWNENAMDRVRLLVEKCDSLQGIQLFGDMDSAFGGISSNLLSCIRDEVSSAKPVFVYSCASKQRNLQVEKLPMETVNEILSLTSMWEDLTLYLPVNCKSQRDSLLLASGIVNMFSPVAKQYFEMSDLASHLLQYPCLKLCNLQVSREGSSQWRNYGFCMDQAAVQRSFAELTVSRLPLQRQDTRAEGRFRLFEDSTYQMRLETCSPIRLSRFELVDKFESKLSSDDHVTNALANLSTKFQNMLKSRRAPYNQLLQEGQSNVELAEYLETLLSIRDSYDQISL
jgi:hypothetical protein